MPKKFFSIVGKEAARHEKRIGVGGSGDSCDIIIIIVVVVVVSKFCALKFDSTIIMF